MGCGGSSDGGSADTASFTNVSVVNRSSLLLTADDKVRDVNGTIALGYDTCTRNGADVAVSDQYGIFNFDGGTDTQIPDIETVPQDYGTHSVTVAGEFNVNVSSSGGQTLNAGFGATNTGASDTITRIPEEIDLNEATTYGELTIPPATQYDTPSFGDFNTNTNDIIVFSLKNYVDDPEGDNLSHKNIYINGVLWGTTTDNSYTIPAIDILDQNGYGHADIQVSFEDVYGAEGEMSTIYIANIVAF